jgi:predicted Zn-dependent protease
MIPMKNLKLLIAVSATLFTLSCTTSPTGRKQLAFMPASQMNEMGAQAFTELKSKQPIERDAKINAYVRCVSDALTEQLSEKGNWEVVVFKDDTPNAFALPGGKIGVHTGLLKVAKTSSQLAAVVGHEIGHVTAQHGNERVSEQFATQVGLAGVSMILAEKQGPQYGLLMAALGAGAQVGILLPHSRTQESEADAMGLELMARAGFDPRESVALWKNMASSGGKQAPEFLSTHPSHGTRIERLQAGMDKAMAAYTSTGPRPTCQL